MSSKATFHSFTSDSRFRYKVMAYPGSRVPRQDFQNLRERLIPDTHRATVRSEIADPQNELRPGMLANFVIRVQKPSRSHRYTGQRRGPRSRWHHDGLGDHRSPPLFVQRIIKTGLRTRRPGAGSSMVCSAENWSLRTAPSSSATCCKRHRAIRSECPDIPLKTTSHVQVSHRILPKPPRHCCVWSDVVCRRRVHCIQVAQYRGVSESHARHSGNYRAGAGPLRRGDGTLLHAPDGDWTLRHSRH